MRLGRTIRQLERELSSAEFSEWQAYYNLDPFDDQREDLRFAMLASMIAALGGVKRPKFKDYMLFPERSAPKVQTRSQILDVAKKVTGWFRGNNRNA